MVSIKTSEKVKTMLTSFFHLDKMTGQQMHSHEDKYLLFQAIKILWLFVRQNSQSKIAPKFGCMFTVGCFSHHTKWRIKCTA